MLPLAGVGNGPKRSIATNSPHYPRESMLPAYMFGAALASLLTRDANSLDAFYAFSHVEP